jgi:hypothetical protein
MLPPTSVRGMFVNGDRIRNCQTSDLGAKLPASRLVWCPLSGSSRGRFGGRHWSKPAIHQGHRRLRVLIFAGLWRTVPDIADDFVRELAAAREPAAKRFNEPLVALSSLGLRGGKRGVGQGWGAGQPEADEDRERFIGNVDMALDPLGLGVVSGVVMAFQFDTNWSVLSKMSGPRSLPSPPTGKRSIDRLRRQYRSPQKSNRH